MQSFKPKLTQAKHNHTYTLKKLKFICILYGKSPFCLQKLPKYIIITILLSVSRSYKNYGYGLGREGRRQLIPIKESATKGVSRLEKDDKT